jgi:hypothetical protein
MMRLCKGNALMNDRKTQSTTKKKVTKIDSVFITFHRNDKSKAICIQSFIGNFRLTAEGASPQIYPAGG